MSDFPRVEIAGCPLNLGGPESFVRFALDRRSKGESTSELSLNALKVVEAHRDPETLTALQSVDVVGCDGVPIRWLLRAASGLTTPRLNGTDLMMRLLEAADREQLRLALVGSTDSTLKAMVDRLAIDYPGSVIATTCNGFEDLRNEAAAVARIADSEPDIVLVALPSPWKEHFVAAHQRQFGPSIIAAVGGSFEVYIGTVSRAPVWMQRSGLEWFHRLLHEPRRLAARYTKQNLAFLRLALPAIWSERFSGRSPT